MIRRELVTPPPPKPEPRIVLEGDDARTLEHLLAMNVTIPHALRVCKDGALADEFYRFTQRFFRGTEVVEVQS